MISYCFRPGSGDFQGLAAYFMDNLLILASFSNSLLLAAKWFAKSGSLCAFLLFQSSEKRDDLFNILWALVFGFASINILSLVVKRFDSKRKGMTFGEILAVLVLIAAGGMLILELLYMFHVLPIKLDSQ
jgi:hypothetical protein